MSKERVQGFYSNLAQTVEFSGHLTTKLVDSKLIDFASFSISSEVIDHHVSYLAFVGLTCLLMLFDHTA